MSVRQTILWNFEHVARDQKMVCPTLSDDLALAESGLDSLCFAIIVARLEDELGVDPFSMSDEVELPRTLGDFVQLYEDAAK